MNPLVTLGASELRALAAAAADGRLNPATPGLVGRFVSDGAAVSRALGEAGGIGCRAGVDTGVAGGSRGATRPSGRPR
jgi:hypothetical protein